MILVPAVKHSASRYVCSVIEEGRPAYLRPTGEVIHKDTGVLHCHPFEQTFEQIKELSREMPTVIPVRHPGLILTSWKKRQKKWLATHRRQGVPKSMCFWNFELQWERIHEIDGFHFCVEQKPFDELENYLGAKVNHTDKVVNSIGEYNEKRDFVTAKDFLGKDWALVEKALDMPLGRKFYASDIRGVRSP